MSGFIGTTLEFTVVKLRAKFDITKKDIFYIVLIIFYVIIFTTQINIHSFERYPGWDHFWVDVQNAGTLISLKHALFDFELPYINPYFGFGWNLAGNHTSFWALPNLLIMIFSPDMVIMSRQILFLMLGALGAYFFIKLIVNNKFIAFFGGITYISIPSVIGSGYYHPSAYAFYLIPTFLVLIHRILEHTRIKYLLFFVALSAFTIGSSNIHILIILPAVVFVYSFLIAFRYYQLGLIQALKKTCILSILCILSGSFYIIPLYNNLHTISSAKIILQKAGCLWATSGLGLQGFLSFFHRYGLESLFKPIEGSGLLLYAPALFYIVIIVSLIFKKDVFKEHPRQTVVIYALILSGFMMFLISVVFYLLPSISKTGQGVLRGHINLIPFMIVLAGFICFAAINKLRVLRIELYALIIVFALIVDIFLFSLHHPKPAVNTLFYIFHAVRELPFASLGLVSSNLIHVRFIEDMWQVLPWLNLLPVVLIFLYSFFWNQRKSTIRNIVLSISVLSVMALSLLNISVHNELKLQQKYTRYSIRSPYRINSYYERKSSIDRMVSRDDPNYRTLYCSKPIWGSKGANWKLIAETELHVQDRIKTPFSYREMWHPYSALLRGTFPASRGRHANLHSPLSSEILGNIATIKLMGVKWIISADSEIIARNVMAGNDSFEIVGDNYNFSQYLDNYKNYLGKKLTLFAWIRTNVRDKYRMQIYDGVDSSFSEKHSGNGEWELLKLTHFVNSSAKFISFRVISASNTGNEKDVVSVNGAMLLSGDCQISDPFLTSENLLKNGLFENWIDSPVKKPRFWGFDGGSGEIRKIAKLMPHLVFKGKCSSEAGPMGLEGEGGTLFIYELPNPTGIAFMVDSYKKVDLIESLKTIYENVEHPWSKNIVYLERDPINKVGLHDKNFKNIFSNLENKAEISSETFNSIEVNVSVTQEKYLILSYLYRPYWKAYIDDSELEIYRAYGGFMCVKIPPGRHIVKFKYYPFDVYIGILMTVVAFLIPLVVRKIF